MLHSNYIHKILQTIFCEIAKLLNLNFAAYLLWNCKIWQTIFCEIAKFCGLSFVKLQNFADYLLWNCKILRNCLRLLVKDSGKSFFTKLKGQKLCGTIAFMVLQSILLPKLGRFNSHILRDSLTICLWLANDNLKVLSLALRLNDFFQRIYCTYVWITRTLL